MKAQVWQILENTVRALRPDIPESAIPSDEAISVSRLATRERAFLAEASAVAGDVFDVALPILLDGYGDCRGAEVASALHRAVLGRFENASAACLEALLEKTESMAVASRRRLAHDLHDRIAHGIGVGIQGIELAELRLARGTGSVTDGLARAATSLTEVLDMVRELASTLRESLDGRSLVDALDHYLSSVAPPGIRFRVVAHGDLATVPRHVAEEVHLVLREAARNVLLHAEGATSLLVTVTVTEGELRACVIDDGPGLPDAQALGSDSGGLSSIRERTRELGGSVRVSTAPGQGVHLAVSVPLRMAAAS
ncbi:ATP-binding protein [Streptomyces sp. NPDC001835]|uniref:sensor histidine kinase n=1 Tax=Streptomyces sp. NPDC001835 TaxID=3154528 RepID=UPI003327309D